MQENVALSDYLINFAVNVREDVNTSCRLAVVNIFILHVSE